jgi:hypothetical protein
MERFGLFLLLFLCVMLGAYAIAQIYETGTHRYVWELYRKCSLPFKIIGAVLL